MLLALSGGAAALLAAADMVFGLVHRPLLLATVAYACLTGLLVFAVLQRGRDRQARLRPTRYSAAVLFLLLTASFACAWRIGSDSTPLVVARELARGDALLAAGDLDGAFLAYLEADRRHPGSLRTLWSLGAVNYRLGDYERARRYFTRALEKAPPSSRWRGLVDLGQTYWKLRRPEVAIEYYHEARGAGLPESELVEWHYRLAWAYFDARDFEAAARHYDAVARAGGKYVAASHYNIACALAQQLESAPEQSRRELVAQAVERLRRARDTADAAEAEAFRLGIAGPPHELDPELAPLQAYEEFRAFARELAGPPAARR